jgi:23S rRNA (guanosine2251-2'-O)-methyltransferase
VKPAVTLYGRNAVIEALRGRRRVSRVWGLEGEIAEVRSQSAGRGSQVAGRRARGPEVVVATREELEALCGSPDHQGLVAEAEHYPYADPDRLLEPEDALVVALDQVQDPQNLGAACRSAECAGATGLVVPERRSAEVTAAVCRTSAGAVEHLPVARVRNLADFLGDAKRRGAWVYGAEAGSEVGYTQPDYSGRIVLVLGREDTGLRPRVRSACDQIVSLPIRGRVSSLNVSAAAAVLLYEVIRQRSEP